jgi:hypothetical protein
MSDYSKMLQKITDLKDKLERQENNNLLKLLYAKVSLLEEMVKNLKPFDLIDKTNISEISDSLSSLKKPNNSLEISNNLKPDISFPEKIQRLRDVATKKIENDQIIYLLYRPTVEFEYENSVKGLEFITQHDTEWIADFEESSIKRDGNSPIISAWIPETQIKDVLNAFGPENNTWGELGTNPNKNKYRILVKPGIYKLHQELKKSKNIFSLFNDLKKNLNSNFFNETSGRHPESPGKDSSNLMPNSKKPKPKKHIRADTMTHMNIVNESDLTKAYEYKGTIRPDRSDPDGMPHPDKSKPYIKVTNSNGDPSWAYSPEFQRKHEMDLMWHFSKNVDRMHPKIKNLLYKLGDKISKDPDRHVIATDNKDGTQSLRLRHLLGIAQGKRSHKVIPDENGIRIEIERHSGRKDIPFETHSWHFDGNNLKFLGKKPIDLVKKGDEYEKFRLERADRRPEKSDSVISKPGNGYDGSRTNADGTTSNSGRNQPSGIFPKKTRWLVKIKGLEGLYPVKNIKDFGENQGNNYKLEDGRVFHQSLIEDLVMESENKKHVFNDPRDQAKYDCGDEEEFKKFKKDPKSFERFFDVTITTPDKNHAIKIKKTANQRSIYDMGKNEVIDIGGTSETSDMNKAWDYKPIVETNKKNLVKNKGINYIKGISPFLERKLKWEN